MESNVNLHLFDDPISLMDEYFISSLPFLAAVCFLIFFAGMIEIFLMIVFWSYWGYLLFRKDARGVNMNSSKLIAEVRADGWILVRINGSHHHFTHPRKPGLVTIPHPNKDLPIKTVKSIKKQATNTPAT